MPNLHKNFLKSVSSRVFPRPNKTKPSDLLKSWKIVRGDEVMVMAGKDKGQKGRVVKVLRDNNSVLVSGLNLVYKHVPVSSATPSGKVQKEMPLHISNVALVDPTNGLPTKVKLRKYTDPKTGVTERRRYAVGTNAYIEKKKYTEYQNEWIDGEKDTDPDIVQKVTFTANPNEPPFPPDLLREIANPRGGII
ncbi:hypothetical protein EV182_001800 [Spiromyces aspiralis]|uniref:Uncharacterized protein n=1 Tax=Spiromyces aspiralis TaxID=68401 RepID=A0ACC1HU40_9FUNG|nr:hypothetical protein EV182_001800 [Spiromyces aspiralis]